MAGLVLELQAEALDGNTPVTGLLRKALVVSRKLGITQIEEWLSQELNGYPFDSDLPLYREIRGQVRVFNPYNGWQSLQFENPDHGEKLSVRKIMQSIGELDAFDPGKGGLQVPFPEHIKNRLMSSMEIPLEPSLHVPYSEVVGILDAVRNIILEWSLELEQKGILGDGLTFSQEEKKTAGQITYQITNHIGNMSNSQLQQASPNASQELTSITNDIEALCSVVNEIKGKYSELGLEGSDQRELSAEIETILSQASSPKPKTGILTESLNTIRNILEGATGSVLASGFLVQLAVFG